MNTGWTGGSYGVGKRMSIKATRACINAILDGSINECEFESIPVFNIQVPKAIDGVPTEILNPKNTWENKSLYDATRDELAEMFVENFKKYITADSDFSSAGPKL